MVTDCHTPLTSARLLTPIWRIQQHGKRSCLACHSLHASITHLIPCAIGPSPISTQPEDLLDEELEAYAAEAELNLDDLPVDEVFSYSDYEDGGPSDKDDDVEMG